MTPAEEPSATRCLAVFPNTTHTLDPPGGRDGAEPAVVHRAAAYIEAHAAEPVTVADLAAADPGRGNIVAAIAARWGFANPGRFAGSYRATFGRHPSVTLRG